MKNTNLNLNVKNFDIFVIMLIFLIIIFLTFKILDSFFNSVIIQLLVNEILSLLYTLFF